MKSDARILGGLTGVFLLCAFLLVFAFIVYMNCFFVVESEEMAILTKRTGADLTNDQELSPGPDTKGVQVEVLRDGARYFYNPYAWDWIVVPQVKVPQNKLGVVVRLHGDDLPPGQLIASTDTQKGIVREILTPGTYAINAKVVQSGDRTPIRPGEPYAAYVELWDPVEVPAGFRGVVTNLTGPLPDDPNVLLVDDGFRGVQETMLDEGRYLFNPYVKAVNLVDCHSQKYRLAEIGELGFPTKDGFWVGLDGVIEFRVKPEEAAKVFVTYNDESNDTPGNRPVDEEIINKIILPNARSFARLRGSSHSGREFISGDTRVQFQEDFQLAMQQKCGVQGIEIIQALITDIRPPQKIAEPVRARQIALQELTQYERQIEQQKSEQELAVEQALVRQKKAIVEADQDVVKVVTEAKKEQEVALIEASKRLAVAEQKLQAARDMAAAKIALGKADADVILFQNEAEAAGWAKAVEAFGDNGDEFARWTLLKKLGPAYQRIMANTNDSPIMDVFDDFNETSTDGSGREFPPYEPKMSTIEELLKNLEIDEDAPLPTAASIRASDVRNTRTPVTPAPSIETTPPAKEATAPAEEPTPTETPATVDAPASVEDAPAP